MGPRPSPDHSIERRNNNGNYEPNNCHWATLQEQTKNKSNRLYYTDGVTLLKDKAESMGVNYSTVLSRLFRGYSVEDSLRLAGINQAFYEYKGENRSLAFWAKKFEIPYKILHNRVHARKWGLAKALEKKYERKQN